MPKTTLQQKKRREEKVLEKDETEKKLESLLFGDGDGFQDALKNGQDADMLALIAVSDESADEAEGDLEEENLDDVADADLFFLDSGAGPVPSELDEAPVTPGEPEDEDEELDELPPVWHDSDDERITVSLASQNRLRKLRVTESEDVISGKEYIRRLRRQYLHLHPTPDWANPKVNKQANEDEDDSDRVDEMDTDDEEATPTQPLAKLLQVVDFTKIENQGPTGGRLKLRKEVIGIQRLKDIGKDQPVSMQQFVSLPVANVVCNIQSAVSSLSFHPHYPLILSSGPASTLFVHHVAPAAPAPNPLLTSLHIRKTPITTSAFAPPGGNQIYASGRRRYFHIWDLNTGKVDKINGSADRREEQKSMERFKLSPCGRYIGLVGSTRKGGGVINIHNTGTAQWIAQVRVDGRGGIADFAWWKNGDGMTVVNLNGEVSEWDGELNRIVARWKDAGGVGTTVLRLGGDLAEQGSPSSSLGLDRYIAIGSKSGIVNVYDRADWNATTLPRNPEPIRALDQLVTPISQIEFAPDGQFLTMASEVKKDALRLVHLPSCTVYKNWPTQSTPLGRITSVAISPNSEYLAVGNDRGRIRLWQIQG
ncbi:WD40 repeat domain-containing protein [Aspergillus lucknowensis]|uniref:WD40-repeat-containing domain protein n=1 Tax=Aspergillus lucknowensis TaxID=176173 RepID=A0ABR4LPI9_9EURO